MGRRRIQMNKIEAIEECRKRGIKTGFLTIMPISKIWAVWDIHPLRVTEDGWIVHNSSKAVVLGNVDSIDNWQESLTDLSTVGANPESMYPAPVSDKSKYRFTPKVYSDGTMDCYQLVRSLEAAQGEAIDPAIEHAIKKLLFGGKRGAKDKLKDWKEAKLSIELAIEAFEQPTTTQTKGANMAIAKPETKATTTKPASKPAKKAAKKPAKKTPTKKGK